MSTPSFNEHVANNAAKLLPSFIGFDKLEFNHLNIISIDFKKLHNISNVKMTIAQDRYSYNRIFFSHETQTYFSTIVIHDNNYFSDLIIGVIIRNNQQMLFTRLTFTISSVDGTNLNPWSYTTYNQHICKTLQYISDQYGIRLDANDMTICSAEVNITISLECEYSKYQRALNKYCTYLPSLKNSNSHSAYTNKKTAKRDGTCYCSNKQHEVIIYDKRSEILEKKYISSETKLPNLLRIEHRLKNGKKIRDAWGTDKWNDLDMKQVFDYFYLILYKKTLKHDRMNVQKKQKEMIAIIKKNQKKYPTCWPMQVVNQVRNIEQDTKIPYILDIEELCNAIEHACGKKDKNVSRKRNYPITHQVENDVFFQHDRDKLDEIFTKIDLAYNCSMKQFKI